MATIVVLVLLLSVSYLGGRRGRAARAPPVLRRLDRELAATTRTMDRLHQDAAAPHKTAEPPADAPRTSRPRLARPHPPAAAPPETQIRRATSDR